MSSAISNILSGELKMSKLKKIHVRKLLEYTTNQLFSILTGEFTLVFDNGEELNTNAKETIYTSFAWQFFRDYPNVVIVPDYHVQRIVGEGRLGSNTHLNLLGVCCWAIYDTYLSSILQSNLPEVKFRDILSEQVYRLTNEMYNELTTRCEAYVVSLDITDLIEVLNEPSIKEANDTVVGNQQSIDATYSTLRDSLLNNTLLDHNPAALAVRAGLVNMEQLLQCVGPRGFVTDTDSVVFPHAITTSFTKGLRSFHDSFIETRSAAKALLFSKAPLQQAEYFSRRLQLMSQIVQNLHMGDCGTTSYLHWTVRNNDIKQLIGKHYLDDDGVLKTITNKSTGLVGKTLRMRSVIHCNHPDPYGICSVCFGDLSVSVPAETNIGQLCCTSLAQKSSQSVLSVKHLDSSSVIGSIVLMEDEKKFLKVANNDNSYLLADKLKGSPLSLIISSTKAANLTDVMAVNDVSELNITRVAELTEIGMLLNVGGTPHTEVLRVDVNGRLASMTYALLSYIKCHGWTIDANGNYLINMENWDWNNEILTLPLRHINLSDHSNSIAAMLESSVEKMQERDKFVSPDAALVELFDLVNDKLRVNLAVLEVVLYATMIRSVENNDYMLPKPNTPKGLGVMRLSMANRSLSAAVAYEQHREVFVNPNSYIQTNRVEHILDKLIQYHN